MSLSNTLKFNSITTLPFAIGLIILSSWLSQFLFINAMWIMLLGTGLLLFSATAWYASKNENYVLSWIINLLDMDWILFTSAFALMLKDLSMLTVAGIFAVNILVCMNVFFQTKGLLQLRKLRLKYKREASV